MKVIVTAGYNQSKHAVALVHQLLNNGVNVQGCIIIKAFSYKRLRYYAKQLDFNEFMKKAKDRILSDYTSSVTVSDESRYINMMLEEYKIKHKTVTSICQENGINYIISESLNNKQSLNFLQDIDLVVYAGGGIVGKKFISKVKTGILNCHAGELPALRGVNVAEWSILMGKKLANSLHFIVRGIDMGPIIKVVERDYSDCTSIDQIRGKAIVYSINDLAETTQEIIKGNYQLTYQTPEQGKQYYTMHPILKYYSERKLRQNDAEVL